jgi:S1-C subfamily serine protease
MKYRMLGKQACVVAVLLLAAHAAAAQPAPAAPALPADPEASRAEAEARMRDAEQRLQEAAREIAELTSRLVGESGVVIQRELAGSARRVMLGINIGSVGGRDAREDGVQVLGVTPGSPADEAGLRSGDVLMSVGDTALDWSEDTAPVDKLLAVLREAEPGTQLAFSYRRDDRLAEVSVEAKPWSWSRLVLDGNTLRGMLPPDAPVPPEFNLPFRLEFNTQPWGDMELVALTPGLGEYFQVSEGVLVVRAPSNPTLGLQDGDVIVDIAGRTPADPGHVVRILRSYSPGERLVMTVVRKGERQQVETDIGG